MRRPWLICLMIVLAACGTDPEQIVIPTRAVLNDPPTVAPPEPTAPVVEIIATQRPRREAAPPPAAALQVAAVGEVGPDESAGVVAGDIFAIEAGNVSLAQLTLDPAIEQNPAWTPDGARLLFDANRDGTTYIYSINALNTNPVQRLSAFPAGEQRQPTVSPDGLNVAFTSSRGGADAIYRMDAIDGRGVRQLTFEPTNDYDPNWSPDNSWIAFTSERDGNPEVYIMDTEGGQAQRLTDHPGIDHQPAFSPDGRQIAFISDRSGTPQVFVMRLPVVRAAFDEVDNSSAIDLNGPISPLPLDTSAPPPDVIPLTADASPKAHPGWYFTPDGFSFLVYAARLGADDNTGYWQIFAANRDGSNIRFVSPPAASLTNPAVRPGTPNQAAAS